MDQNDIKTSWFGEMEFNSFGGAWYPAVHVRDEDELASVAEYQFSEDDVLLCSFPRSGWSNFPFKRVAICSLQGRRNDFWIGGGAKNFLPPPPLFLRPCSVRPGHTKDYHKMAQTASLHSTQCIRVGV